MEKQEKVVMLVHTKDYDKVMSAFILANGFLSFGMEVMMFFTFWGIEVLKKSGKRLPLSRKKWMKPLLKIIMKKKGVADIEELLRSFKNLGGKIIACTMTMDLMGIKKEDLIQEYIDSYAGVGNFVNEARDASLVLPIF